MSGTVYNLTLPNPCVELKQEDNQLGLLITLMKCFPKVRPFTTYVMYTASPLFAIRNLRYIEDFITYIRVQGSRNVMTMMMTMAMMISIISMIKILTSNSRL